MDVATYLSQFKLVPSLDGKYLSGLIQVYRKVVDDMTSLTDKTNASVEDTVKSVFESDEATKECASILSENVFSLVFSELETDPHLSYFLVDSLEMLLTAVRNERTSVVNRVARKQGKGSEVTAQVDELKQVGEDVRENISLMYKLLEHQSALPSDLPMKDFTVKRGDKKGEKIRVLDLPRLPRTTGNVRLTKGLNVSTGRNMRFIWNNEELPKGLALVEVIEDYVNQGKHRTNFFEVRDLVQTQTGVKRIYAHNWTVEFPTGTLSGEPVTNGEVEDEVEVSESE